MTCNRNLINLKRKKIQDAAQQENFRAGTLNEDGIVEKQQQLDANDTQTNDLQEFINHKVEMIENLKKEKDMKQS